MEDIEISRIFFDSLFRKNRLSAVLQICSSSLRASLATDKVNMIAQDAIIEYIKKVTLTRDDIFTSCAWLGEPFECNKLDLFLTERGVCFSFNMLNTRSIYKDMYAELMLPKCRLFWIENLLLLLELRQSY